MGSNANNYAILSNGLGHLRSLASAGRLAIGP